MKNLLILLFLILTATSCRKDPPTPEGNYNPIGITWELHSARVFVDNLDQNQKIYYDHFGPNRTSSNLDIFSPSQNQFDMISAGQTTWKFASASSDFILDGYSTYQYNYLNTGSVFNVFGLENGSARPVEMLYCTPNELHVKVFTSYGNDGQYNYNFYSVLSFVRAGNTKPPVILDVPPNYSYGGILYSQIGVETSKLTGTTWVVTKYIQNLQTIYTNDTLDFVTDNTYTINGSQERTYLLSEQVISNMRTLSLYQFTTLGGDWEGRIQPTFLQDGEINNADFNDLFIVTRRASVFMQRIN
jgi:hypothetical protein